MVKQKNGISVFKARWVQSWPQHVSLSTFSGFWPVFYSNLQCFLRLSITQKVSDKRSRWSDFIRGSEAAWDRQLSSWTHIHSCAYKWMSQRLLLMDYGDWMWLWSDDQDSKLSQPAKYVHAFDAGQTGSSVSRQHRLDQISCFKCVKNVHVCAKRCTDLSLYNQLGKYTRVKVVNVCTALRKLLCQIKDDRLSSSCQL